MPFTNFTNPYQNPAAVPARYRSHQELRKLFRSEGSYIRPAEDPVTLWAITILHEEYGVPLEAMGLELSANFDQGTHQSGRRYMRRVQTAVAAEPSKELQAIDEKMGTCES
jgi:type I restriction enzyme M protein